MSPEDRVFSDRTYISELNRELMIASAQREDAEAERDRYRDALVRLSKLLRVKSSPTAARIIAVALDEGTR